MAHGVEFLLVGARKRDDGLQLFNSLFAQTYGAQLFVYLVKAYLVELVNGHGDVDNLVGCTYNLGYAAENFAVVDLDADANAETAEYLVDNLHQLYLVEQ